MSEEQKPFMCLRICQTCGFWKVTNAIVDAFASMAGTQHMCPEGCGELHVIQPEEGLMVTERVGDAS